MALTRCMGRHVREGLNLCVGPVARRSARLGLVVCHRSHSGQGQVEEQWTTAVPVVAPQMTRAASLRQGKIVIAKPQRG